MSADGGKPGLVGELHGRSIEELMEILDRQQKLLANKNFITKLPDRGKKIFDYTEKVKIAIDEHNRLKKKTDLLSTFRTEFQAQQFNMKENLQTTAESQDKVTQAPAAVTLYSKSSKSGNNATETNHLHNVGTSMSSIPVAANQETCRNDPDTAEDATNALVNSLKGFHIKDHVDDLTKVTTETSANQEKNSSYQVSPGLKRSHYMEVIERRQKNPVGKTEKFRTNRLASNSNSPTPNRSPAEGAQRMSMEERRKHDRKHLDDITAARIPPLHYSQAQLLPLDESLRLQIAQMQSYEEKQAKLAAQKLLAKLNLNMGTYNPEGDSYMKYRDQKDDENYGVEE